MMVLDIQSIVQLKTLLGMAAILLTFIAFIPYIQSIIKGKTKPHVFSWVIWGSTTFVVFLAQLAGGAGMGSWAIGVSGIITLGIAYLAYQKRADISITRMDWFFFISALSAIPLWVVTSNPLWAVVIITVVDFVGFFPTFRKVYHHPYQDQLVFYVIMGIRNFMVVAALDHYSLTTALFPATMGFACILFIALVLVRRRVCSDLTFTVIKYGSPAYKEAVALREQELRKVLGLTFLPEEIKEEKDWIHIGAYYKGQLCGTSALVPQDEGWVKMCRVAVKKKLQGRGFGRQIMRYTELYAREQGFTDLYLHARDTSIPFYEANGYSVVGDWFNEDTVPHKKLFKKLS